VAPVSSHFLGKANMISQVKILQVKMLLKIV